jgi:hypothetical protein
MYHTLHEARCSRCKRTYSSLSHPKGEGWHQAVFEDLGGNDYPYDPDVVHLCKPCSMLAREFIENETPIPVSSPDEEPLAAWERELLGEPAPVDGEALLDRLVDLMYPLDEYRGHQWNGGDVCDAVAQIIREYRPQAESRQPLEPWPLEVVASDVEPAHKHEWRWSNTRWDDRITRRYCIGCGVLFTDL